MNYLCASEAKLIGGGSEKKGKTSIEINWQIHPHPLNFVYGGVYWSMSH